MDNEKKTKQDINPSLKGKKLWDFTAEERAAMSAKELGSLYLQSMVDGIASAGEAKEKAEAEENCKPRQENEQNT